MKIKFYLLLLGCLSLLTLANAQTSVFLAGAGNDEVFNTIFPLSDGTYLVGGSASHLFWLPQGTFVKTLGGASAINSAATGKVAFIIHLNQDMTRVLDAVKFPDGTVTDVFRIRATNVPGQTTGELFISGKRTTTLATTAGYYIAKLSANFINSVPDSCVWTYDAVCPTTSGSGDYTNLQPWDVFADGRVIFGRGESYGFNWAEIRRLDPAGKPETVPNWFAHWRGAREYNGDFSYLTSAQVRVDSLDYSAIVLKANRRGSMRSYTQAMYDSMQADENNNFGRKGLYPDDYYFSGPCPFNTPCISSGPGYTGYRLGSGVTARLGSIVVDRRNGNFYYGYSMQTKLPDGLPDFEPVIVAMDFSGQLTWWARLYQEQSTNSTPDQYVDRMEMDYANNQIVVAARCHGNNVFNHWSGNNLANNPSATGFQNRFTGNSGNIHITWLGKYDVANGKIMHATYMAELPEGITTRLGAPYTEPNYRAWPNFNLGYPDVNTTRINSLSISPDGTIIVSGLGRRTFTTQNAYQEMPLPGNNLRGTWNNFVRAYSSDLSRVIYSSLLTGEWDQSTGNGGDNIAIKMAIAGQNKIIAVGSHTNVPNKVKVVNRPAWGVDSLLGNMALVGILSTDSLSTVGLGDRQLASGLRIWPNPAKDILTIETNSHIHDVVIYDVLGQLVLRSTQNQVPVHHLPNGVYMVVVNGQRKRFVRGE